ncbi:glucosamine-6-phosphate deaminase [Portibacter lacus]|uniref:Glucosamine-6-phosphate deaminase n=1 Tax=Portibacter lacus TaxID=1099794 RepID=A0AA37SMB3_9BACT|nr:glucosamine-6-phosphate deaminase [Portibacter lacus]GLR16382.1 glucosamine-6-phosphate deaminase [Portibacter lacus]
MKTIDIDQLKVSIYKDTEEMGQAAADFAADKINSAIDDRGLANLILATGASQFSFLKALKQKEIDWAKVVVFHLDEYIGLSDSHPASFRKYLKDRILDEVKPSQVFLLNGDAEDIEAEIDRYSQELSDRSFDLACIGIGENGHIAFNDPPIADFNDPKLVKIAELDDACRNQQFGEGWFPSFEAVPKKALSLTIPAIMRCKTICCVVPDERKAEAVKNALFAKISTACPATILRKHSNTRIFLDTLSASQLDMF